MHFDMSFGGIILTWVSFSLLSVLSKSSDRLPKAAELLRGWTASRPSRVRDQKINKESNKKYSSPLRMVGVEHRLKKW